MSSYNHPEKYFLAQPNLGTIRIWIYMVIAYKIYGPYIYPCKTKILHDTLIVLLSYMPLQS